MSGLPSFWYRLAPFHLFLIPVSGLFIALSTLRRILYKIKLLRSIRLSVPVIVVGNISVGGTGKTPLTLWLAEQLIAQGWQPGIVSRGYGGKNDTPRTVLAHTSTKEAGDEPVLMAQRNLCPVWIGRDRPTAAQALLTAHPTCNIIICDDGLQHYRLQRDVEIVVIDGIRRHGNGLRLPAGPLREPISRLKTVDAIVTNGGTPQANEFAMQLVGTQFYNLLTPSLTRNAADFTEKNLHAIAAIGNPQRFFNTLQSMGLEVHTHPFPDHYAYHAEDIHYPDADAILMTEKDAVKCTAFAHENCWVLRVDAQLSTDLIQLITKKVTS